MNLNRFLIATIAVTGMILSGCQNKVEVSSIPDYPIAGGVSAPFAGFVGNTLIVAGGCNFPDTPAAEGGKKAFYAQAYAIDVDSDGAWTELPTLPAPVAYGATVATDKGLVCMGGQNEQGAVTDVYIYATDGMVTALPSLPASIDNGGAAIAGNTVYVTGGNQPEKGQALYALDMASPTQWQRLPDYPGPQRVQPVVLASEEALYLIGGFAFDRDSMVCTPSTDMLRYDIAARQWQPLDTIVAEQDGTVRCLVGGSGVVKDGKLILTGGVNMAIFKQAMEGKGPADYMTKPVEWYRFNDDLLTYDPATRSWQVTPDVSGMARAGGILLEHDGTLYMVCGELKPGIRTPQITVRQ